MDYQINETDLNNSDPLTDISHITLNDVALNEEPLSSKASVPTDNDPSIYLPFPRKNVPYTVDTVSIDNEPKSRMNNHNTLPLSSSIWRDPRKVRDTTEEHNSNIPTETASFNHYLPSYLSTRINSSNKLPIKRSNTFPERSERSIDLVSSTLSSNIDLRSKHDSQKPDNIRPTAARPWTKHPRWVLRLSQPKRNHTSSFTSSRPSSRERLSNSLSSSARSVATIPRYAFYEE